MPEIYRYNVFRRIGDAIGAVVEAAVRVTSAGDMRVTADGDRRVLRLVLAGPPARLTANGDRRVTSGGDVRVIVEG